MHSWRCVIYLCLCSGVQFLAIKEVGDFSDYELSTRLSVNGKGLSSVFEITLKIQDKGSRLDNRDWKPNLDSAKPKPNSATNTPRSQSPPKAEVSQLRIAAAESRWRRARRQMAFEMLPELPVSRAATWQRPSKGNQQMGKILRISAGSISDHFHKDLEIAS